MTAMDAQFLQHGFDPEVAGRCLLVVGVVKRKCLLERKQMLGAVASGERLRDRLGAGVAAVMAQARQRPACSPATASPSAWTARVHGETTCSSSGCGAASNTRRSLREPTKRSARRDIRSAGISSFITDEGPIRVLKT